MAVLRSRQAPAGHAAGIYADMTLDGPEIGTLVAVIDRAKNLPNRRTMGKQDPYCAMRLAKEAKKTETDRRGGQTPKWDQELRFNVHDSPDYYKLKCSIFNDDKKADLIGEAWIDLRDVIKPGGGQRDIWQQLNFKGKYAGDIRMELTYYDSREKPVEKKSASDRSRTNNAASDFPTANGPRQLGPRDIPRRPLPANPVSQQPPLPAVPSQSQQSTRIAPRAFHGEPQGQMQVQMHVPVPVRPFEQPTEDYHEPYVEDMEEEYTDDYSQEHQYDHPDHFDIQHEQQQQQRQHQSGMDFRNYAASCDHLQLDEMHDPGLVNMHHQQSKSFPLTLLQQSTYPDDEELWGSSRPQLSHTHSAPSSPYSSPLSSRPMPSPANSDGQLPLYRHQDRSGGSPTKTPTFKDSPLRQSISHYDEHPEHESEPTQDIPPPPPPKHRDTPPRKPRSEYPPSSYMPQPLRLSGKRTSVNDRSPLQAIEDSSNARRLGGLVQPQTPNRHTLHDPYGRETAQQQIEFYNRRRSSYGSQQEDSNSPLEVQRPRSQHAYDSQHMQQVDHESPAMHEQFRMRSSMDSNSIGHNQEQRRRSGIEPRAVSPSPHANLSRNSVNHDSPYPPMENRRLSGIPFGPDSYDVLNPGSSPVTNEGTVFETPEQARDSGRLRDAERARDHGPIIGNDGLEIDPSDHLPSDTWAPEPERKNKKPEHVIHIRSKTNTSAPTSNRSSPMVTRSIGNSPYQSSHFGSSPQLNSPTVVAGRNRLQKPISTRPLPSQPFQQPAKKNHQQMQPATFNPTAVDPNQRPRRSSWRADSPADVVRPAPSEYQVPIGSNYGSRGPVPGQFQGSVPASKSTSPYGTGYSHYEQRNSHYGRINANSYDDPLAAEMSMIDIGPSRGSAGRTRLRSNRGF